MNVLFYGPDCEYNGFYVNGNLKEQGGPERLDVVSVAKALSATGQAWKMYEVPMSVYDEYMDGEGYPALLADMQVSLCKDITQQTREWWGI